MPKSIESTMAPRSKRSDELREMLHDEPLRSVERFAREMVKKSITSVLTERDHSTILRLRSCLDELIESVSRNEMVQRTKHRAEYNKYKEATQKRGTKVPPCVGHAFQED